MGNWFGSYFCNWFGASGSVVIDASVRTLDRFSGEEKKEKKLTRPRDSEEEELAVLLAVVCGVYSRGLS